MEKGLREVLVTELEGRTTSEKTSMDEIAREVLVAVLGMDKKVFDAMNIDIGGKRKRGRSKKETILGNGEVCTAEDPSKCWKHGRKVLIEEAKEKERNRVRLNPQPTRDLERELDLDSELREVGWDIEEVPDNQAETDNMLTDMENLRREAGMRKLDDSFKPFSEYKKRWTEYREAKKHAAMLHKQAAISLKRRNFDDVEEMLGTLKKEPKRIQDSYQKILEAYEDCCGALCDEIDKRVDKNRGLDDATALEAEKQEYGLMQGESSGAYQKRMRKIGKGKEIPETIKKVDEIVKQTERRWRSIAGIGQDEFNTIKDNFRKTFQNLMKGCSLATNRGIAGVNGILEEHLKSQHDMVKKGEKFDNGNFSHHMIVGGRDDDPRNKFSRKCFGVEKGLKPSKYEKYGCMHTLSPREGDNLTGGQYGKNVIRWKPSKTVATMTFTDSLCLSRDGLNYVTPCLVTDPSPCCFNPENKKVIDALREKPMSIGLETLCGMMGTEYCELQLHGEDQYDADAIESISFGSEDDIKNLSAKAVAKIREKKIPIYLRSKPIKMDEEGQIVGY